MSDQAYELEQEVLRLAEEAKPKAKKAKKEVVEEEKIEEEKEIVEETVETPIVEEEK